uniref:WAP domain-containing protein n=1 Tax=Naja naja TaxID=35670 RepID=A0A8C6Y256_NAJNA
MKSPSFWLLLGMVTSTAERGRAGEWAPSQLSSWWSGPAGRVLYCLSDASCPGHEKCCSLGRMRICVQPALGRRAAREGGAAL